MFDSDMQKTFHAKAPCPKICAQRNSWSTLYGTVLSWTSSYCAFNWSEISWCACKNGAVSDDRPCNSGRTVDICSFFGIIGANHFCVSFDLSVRSCHLIHACSFTFVCRDSPALFDSQIQSELGCSCRRQATLDSMGNHPRHSTVFPDRFPTSHPAKIENR